MKKSSRARGARTFSGWRECHFFEQKLSGKTQRRYLSFDGTSKVVIDWVPALTSVIAEEMVLDLAD